MRRSEALQGVRMIKFVEVLGRYEAAEFSQLEAAALLGIGERTFRRWRERFEDDGEAGLLDRRLGKASGKRVPLDREAEVEALYRTRYAGFTAKHFHEHLVQRHGFAWGYTWTKTFLHSKGLLERAERRGAHRRKRPRRPLPGMMVHQDGSRHAWLGGQPALDLIVTLDDATSAILSAFLAEEEGTASTFRALREVFERHGLPLSLYTDRGAHYFYTADAKEKAGRAGLTQVGRALEHLGVEQIAAYSPHSPSRDGRPSGRPSRGRSERAFHTLQDRLTKELALAKITTVDDANAFIRDIYIPAHNARFAIPAEQEGSAFVAIPGVALAEILCIQEERDVGNDNCVRFKRLKLQIPESPLRAHFVKARVKVRQYPDGTHAIFSRPKMLGTLDQKGAFGKEMAA
jgi:transposase